MGHPNPNAQHNNAPGFSGGYGQPEWPHQPPLTPVSAPKPTVTLRRSTLGLVLVLEFLVVGLVAALVALAASGFFSSSKSPDPVGAKADGAVITEEDLQGSAAEEDVPVTVSIGEATATGGVEATVEAVSRPSRIEVYEDGDYRNRTPRSGNYFLLVKFLIKNIGASSFDPLYALTTAVIDTDDRMFDPIEDNYAVRLNFEASVDDEIPDRLQPESSAVVHYLYELPNSATADYLGFHAARSDSRSDVRYLFFSQE